MTINDSRRLNNAQSANDRCDGGDFYDEFNWFDHYGLLGAAVRPMDLSRLVGMTLLVAGVWLTVK